MIQSINQYVNINMRGSSAYKFLTNIILKQKNPPTENLVGGLFIFKIYKVLKKLFS